MKESRFTDGQILVLLKQAEAEVPVPAVCREHRINVAMFYRTSLACGLTESGVNWSALKLLTHL
jgi:hypothetical protein